MNNGDRVGYAGIVIGRQGRCLHDTRGRIGFRQPHSLAQGIRKIRPARKNDLVSRRIRDPTNRARHHPRNRRPSLDTAQAFDRPAMTPRPLIDAKTAM